MKRYFLIMIAVAVSFGGCDFPPNLSQSFKNSTSRAVLATVDEEKVALAEAVMWAKPAKIVFKKDIFRPLIACRSASSGADKAIVVTDVSALELSGTLASENPVAFIRNTVEKKNYVVREQGTIGSFQVIKIDPKGVKLQKDGKDFYLKIPEAKK